MLLNKPADYTTDEYNNTDECSTHRRLNLHFQVALPSVLVRAGALLDLRGRAGKGFTAPCLVSMVE
jgi:hypothetical protein